VRRRHLRPGQAHVAEQEESAVALALAPAPAGQSRRKSEMVLGYVSFVFKEFLGRS